MVKILIADDSLFMRKIMQKILLKGGFEDLSFVDNGSIIFDRINVENYDLLILDQNMSGMDGLSVLKNIKRNGLNLKVLFVSAVDEAEFKKTVSEFEVVVGYIEKPFNYDYFLNTVKEIVK
jgi:two-component system, chemotaxis family, chemotaxis protein CheY